MYTFSCYHIHVFMLCVCTLVRFIMFTTFMYVCVYLCTYCLYMCMWGWGVWCGACAKLLLK